MAVRAMRAPTTSSTAAQVQRCVGGLRAAGARAAQRRGPQAGALLLRRLRLARAGRRDGPEQREASAVDRGGPPLGGGRPRPLRRHAACASLLPGRDARPVARRHGGALHRRHRPRQRQLDCARRVASRGAGARGARSPGREALSMIAADTGGRFFDDANDLGRVLAEMLEMTSRYYVLGFQPARGEGAGQLPQGQGEGRAQGREALAPPRLLRGERAAQPALQRQFDARAARGDRGGRQRPPPSRLCLPSPPPGEKQTLGVVVQVPARRRCQAGQRAGGRRSTATRGRRRHGLRPPRAAPEARPGARRPARPRAGLSLFGTFDVPPGRYTIRLLVREAASGRARCRSST